MSNLNEIENKENAESEPAKNSEENADESAPAAVSEDVKSEDAAQGESTPVAVSEDVKIEDAAKGDTEEAKENSEEVKAAENADSIAIVDLDVPAEMQKEDERPANLIEPAEETVTPAKTSETPTELAIDSDEQVILT